MITVHDDGDGCTCRLKETTNTSAHTRLRVTVNLRPVPRHRRQLNLDTKQPRPICHVPTGNKIATQQTRNIRTTCLQRRPNVFDAQMPYKFCSVSAG